MRTQTFEYTKLIADEGYFLTNGNGLYGTELILGDNDSIENYEERPLSEWPENESDDIEQPFAEENYESLEEAKNAKIAEIEAYDISPNVNGFIYNDIFMWLDRETRASLKNTIESLELVGRDELNIWYENAHITLDLNSAKNLLALLEVYATDCYNVTAQHKFLISNMTEIEDIVNFDISKDYPEILNFNTI